MTGIKTLGRRDHWTCSLCGKRVDRHLPRFHPMSATRDHVVPVSAGGKNRHTNLRLAHKSCNEQRGVLPVKQFRVAVGYEPPLSDRQKEMLARRERRQAIFERMQAA